MVSCKLEYSRAVLFQVEPNCPASVRIRLVCLRSTPYKEHVFEKNVRFLLSLLSCLPNDSNPHFLTWRVFKCGVQILEGCIYFTFSILNCGVYQQAAFKRQNAIRKGYQEFCNLGAVLEKNICIMCCEKQLSLSFKFILLHTV